ncbi:uncharacterized protein LOC126846699 [Adelges cooleyi]|uniref:uncharacterized protein LOC126846699 n=1 Tax=Adelges cooleyi TaxID=133065 RepID=UPI00217F39FD|nr:uncharacterized protein LOC126846699 [Adelges cooleyi]
MDFVLCVLLLTFFGTNDCKIKVKVGDIAIFVTPETNEPSCVKYNGHNLDLGVGELMTYMSPKHEKYQYYADKAKEDGTYDYDIAFEIYDLYQAKIDKFTDDYILLDYVSMLTGYSDEDISKNDDKNEGNDKRNKKILIAQ